MRLFLLALAAFYAWLPTGLCACRLQAALFPPSQSASHDLPAAPADDDDDGPNECHCTGAKPLCDVPVVPSCQDDSRVTLFSVINLVDGLPESAVVAVYAIPPFQEPPQSPLYLTLRALLI
jgi:hypothetical protein